MTNEAQSKPQESSDEQKADENGSRTELDKVRAERDDYLNLLKRTKADFENYQKRMQKERQQERQYMYGPLLFDLLPILDNLQRAIDAATQAGETSSLVDGVVLVQKQFLDLLKRYQVHPIEAEGKPFDPHLHQAMMQQPSAEHEPNTVIQVIEQGYTTHDRVLRPAKVIVSRAVE